MKLTDKAIKGAKPEKKVKKLFDGNGLILLVWPNGSKYWSYKYRHLGKEKSLSLGVYPEVSLAEARQKLIDVRRLVSDGKDPSEVRKAIKRQAMLSAENSFESVAREWHEMKKHTWDTRYAGFIIKRLEADIFPKLGSRPITDITAPELLSVLRIIEKRGALEMAHRALKVCGMIFMYAIATGRAERNPANDLQGALKTAKKENFAHLEETELPEFLQKLENYQGNKQNQLGVKLLILTFVRTTELRGAEWSEIDFKKAEWRIQAERMKMRRPHIVPLSKQALLILKELKLMNGAWKYVFPNPYKPLKHMSENGILNVIYRMGYKGKTTGHGFRHTASTILNEHGFNRDHIERQLAHIEGNKVRGAYNHAEYLPDRRNMMQWWADYLDSLGGGVEKKGLPDKLVFLARNRIDAMSNSEPDSLLWCDWDAADDKRFKDFISRLLEILGDRALAGAQDELERAFRTELAPVDETLTITITKLERFKYNAVKYLVSASAKEAAFQSPDYKSFIKKITRLRDALKESANLLSDKDIQLFIRDILDRENKVSSDVVIGFHQHVSQYNHRLAIRLSMFLHNPSGTKGRPSLAALYKYALEVGRLFERITNTKFSIYRHGMDIGDGNKAYVPITPAHQFAAEAIQYINEEARLEGARVIYTDKNIYNACESVQKKLKQEREDYSSPKK